MRCLNAMFYLIDNFKSLGCFIDQSSSRAISGKSVDYDPAEAIEKCYEKAKKEGNTHFAVQFNVQCFTSNDAGDTYDKHGAGDGCSNGRGGAARNSVYQIIGNQNNP